VVGGPQGGAGPQNVTAPSGPVMSPPSIVPPVEAPTVPTVIPTPTVAPAAGATPPSTVPTTQPTAGRVSTTGAQFPRERPPTTKERHPKRATTEAAATLQTLQLAAGGEPTGPPATVAATGSQADQQWEEPGQRSDGCGRWASNSKGKPKQKPPTRASRRLPQWHKTLWKPPTQRHGKPGRSVWRLWAPFQ
jgi:hypothetical protein